MENVNFIEALKALTTQEDLLAVSNEINELRSKFNDYVLEEERKAQVAQLEVAEGAEEIVEAVTDFGKEAFYEIYNAYKTQRKALLDAQKATEEENLTLKKGLISKLRNVVQNEENIGAAFGAFKEVQENWKEIGDIPRAKRSDIQAEYSKLIEDFFYNIKIYKELKDHDFHRNHQLKLEIIDKLKKLISVKNLKEVEVQLKSLQNDWEDIGPVPNENWEEVKDAYWTEVRSIYDRVNRFYDDRRNEQLENLTKKREIIVALNESLTNLEELQSIKDWDDKTTTVLEAQQKWKTIGFGPKKENEEIWKEFRTICDTFFQAKKDFFKDANAAFDAVADKKNNLVEQAKQLSASTDWKETANKIIQLQKEWKNLGHAGRKNEQKLWKNFRSACDAFFAARQAHFDEQDKAFEVNLAEKEKVVSELEALTLPENKNEALEMLKTISAQYNEIGHVPMKAKDGLYKRFKAAMDTHYGALKMEGAEKDRVMFEAKLDTIQASPNSNRQLSDLKYEIRQEIDRQKKEIFQLENNLGFFAKSKGADALRKEVEKKVERANEKINALKQKLKSIPNE